MAIDLKALLPRPTERMFIVGASGTGKTTFARHLLRVSRSPRIVVIDSKCTYGGVAGEAGYLMTRTPRELARAIKRERRVIYRPDIGYQDSAGYEAVYEAIFRLEGNRLCYTDETYLTMRGTKAPDWQRACVTCGRELGLSMIFSTQRPRGIDPRIFTESESRACFDLRRKDDRKAVAEEMGDEVMERPPRHACWWIRDGMDRPRLIRLDLGGS